MNKGYSIIENSFSKEEIQQASEAFQRHLMQPMASQNNFEEAIMEYTKSRYALVCNSGTSALHLALLANGIGKGDEVFCPSFAFGAVANAIIYTGAKPVFVDNEPLKLHISPQIIYEELNHRKKNNQKIPKALILIHSYGMPADVETIKTLCQENNIRLIEDAAGALGAFYKNNHVGTIGNTGIISFNLNKIISTGGGGVMLTNDEKLYLKARDLARQAKSSMDSYNYNSIGYNYVMHPFAAELGTVKLESIEIAVESKSISYNKILANFSDSVINTSAENKDVSPNFWRIMVRKGFNHSEFFFENLWSPLHKQPPYQHYKFIGSDHINGLADQYLFIKNI